MNRRTLWLAFVVAQSAGCAPLATSPPLPADHPANPRAAESPLPPRSQTLPLDEPAPAAAEKTEPAGHGGGHVHGGQP